MVWIALAIVAATAMGVWAEERYGEGATGLSRRLLRVVLYVILPPVVYLNLARAELDAEVGVGVLCAYAALAVSVFVAWLVSTRVLGLNRAQTGSVMCCTVIANTGYLGYAVVAGVMGLDSLPEAVVYDIVVAGPALILGAFSIGAAFGDTAGEGVGERVAAFFTRNPALYAGALGLVVPDALAPDVAVDVSRIVVIAVLPIGFFAVGTALAEEADEGTLALPPPVDKAIAAAVAVRFCVAPLALLAIAAPLIDLPDQYLLLAAMPCGINSLIVTHTYGLDLRVTSAAVAWSTAIAVPVLLVAPLLA